MQWYECNPQRPRRRTQVIWTQSAIREGLAEQRRRVPPEYRPIFYFQICKTWLSSRRPGWGEIWEYSCLWKIYPFSAASSWLSGKRKGQRKASTGGLHKIENCDWEPQPHLKFIECICLVRTRWSKNFAVRKRQKCNIARRSDLSHSLLCPGKWLAKRCRSSRKILPSSNKYQ